MTLAVIPKTKRDIAHELVHHLHLPSWETRELSTLSHTTLLRFARALIPGFTPNYVIDRRPPTGKPRPDITKNSIQFPMVRVTPTTQPTNVDTDGTIVTVPIGIPRVGRALHRLVVANTSGSLTTFTAEWSTDSTVSDSTKTIIKETGGTSTKPLDRESGHARGFSYEDNSHDGNLYVKIVPNTGSDNDFTVAAYLEA